MAYAGVGAESIHVEFGVSLEFGFEVHVPATSASGSCCSYVFLFWIISLRRSLLLRQQHSTNQVSRLVAVHVHFRTGRTLVVRSVRFGGWSMPEHSNACACSER